MAINFLRNGTLALALTASAGVALAAVTFDPATGTGFVGKGDVQLAMGWNNAVLQAKVANKAVNFTYEVSEQFQQECLTTGGIKTFTGYRTQEKGVDSQVQYDSRTSKQVNGFILKGFGTKTIIDEVWVGPNGETSGNACPDGSSPHGPKSLISSTDGLLVNGVKLNY